MILDMKALRSKNKEQGQGIVQEFMLSFYGLLYLRSKYTASLLTC